MNKMKGKDTFEKYLKRLETLNVEKTLLKGRKMVLLLSGSSNYKSAALSPVQKSFLNIFSEAGYEPVWTNFPYNSEAENNNYREADIMEASISNIFYYIQTLYNKRFRKEIKRHLEPLFTQTCRNTGTPWEENIYEKREVVIVVQSSGLNMLKQFLRDITSGISSGRIKDKIIEAYGEKDIDGKGVKEGFKYSSIPEIKILSLGPVAKGTEKELKQLTGNFIKRENIVIFKGKRDIWSKLLDFHKCDVEIGCGHLDYLESEELKEKVHEWLWKNKG